MKRNKGFTLIEICVVLFVGGLVLVSGIDLVKQYKAHQVINTNNERIATIKKAITGYIGKNTRLPCVAQRNLTPMSTNYGKSISCNGIAMAGTVLADGAIDTTKKVRIGAVPVRELGLSDAYIADAWGNLFTYAVAEALTVAPIDPTRASIDIINPLSGTSDVSPPGSVLYMVVSAGKDGKGAWSTQGKQVAPCPPAAPGYDTENCNDDAKFFSASYSTAQAAQHFDDQIEYSNTVNNLVLPVCTATQVLTSDDGVNFQCQEMAPPAPPVCQSWQRLTSDDGLTFSCEDLPVITPAPPLPTCAAGQGLTANGSSMSCTNIPPPPASLTLPVCGAGQTLVANGTGFICKDLVVKSLEVTCLGVKTSSTTPAYICQANCPAGTRVTGGGFIWNSVQSDNSKTFEQQGTNGYKCSVVMEAAQYAACGGCGMTCSATCAWVE